MKLLALAVISYSLFAQATDPNQVRVRPRSIGGSVTPGSVQFFGSDNSHAISLTAPPSLSANQTVILPPVNSAGCMNNNGVGVLAYGPCGDSAPVSDQSPMYLYTHFRDTDSANMYFSYSRDALNFVDVNPNGTAVNTTENRDPSIIYENGLFYIVASPSATTGASKIQIWTTPDLVNFSGPTLIDMYPSYGSANGCCSFAPEWFIDPNSGNTYIVATNSHDGTVTFQPWFLQINMSTLSVAAATQVTLSGTTQNLIFDNYVFWDAGTSMYYMMYVDEVTGTPPPGYQQRIAWATSSTLLGTYTQVPATGADAFGFSTTSEAASVLQLPVGLTVTIPNNGFESGTLAPWAVVSGAASATNTVHHFGLWSAALTSTSATNIISQSVSGLSPGQQYQYSGWVRGSANGISATTTIQVWDGVTTGSIVQASVTPTTTFQKLILTFTAPASGTVSISGQTTALTSAGSVYVDDLSIDALDCLRTYADTWLFTFFRGNSFNAGNGRKYLPQYRDSCRTSSSTARFLTLQGTQVAPMIISSAEHGTLLKITDPLVADIVYTAQSHYGNIKQVSARLGVGTTNPFFTVTAKSQNANGNLQYNEPPSLAAEQSNGDTAIWTGCGTTALTCPPPWAGAGKWVMNHSDSGGSGMIQLNNTNTDTGESSVMYGNGVFAFGTVPITASTSGNNAIWTQGSNNQFYGDISGGLNVGNNAFFLYNKGLGALDQTTPATGNTNVTAINFVVTGDSHMAGFGQTGSSPPGACGAGTGFNCIPNQVTDAHGITLHNLAISGSNFCSTFAIPTEEATIDALYNPTSRANIILIEGGGNDMKGAISAAQVFQCQKEFGQRRRIKGWSVILYGMYSRGDGLGTYGWFIDKWHDDLNQLYANGYESFADAYINIAADTNVGVDGDYSNATYFQGDNIHVKNTYTSTLAALISAKVTAIANRASQTPISNIGAFPVTISAFDGSQRALYGVTLGPGDQATQSLSSNTWGNIDAFGVGLLNIGNGTLGDHNAYVRLGALSASTGLFLGFQGVEAATMSVTGAFGATPVVAIGNGTIGDRSAIVTAGFVDALNLFSVNGVNGFTGTCTVLPTVVGGIVTSC